MKIGFFGDSFCAKNYIDTNEYTTYINKLETHYNADIVNLGVPGSSIYDLMLLQLNPFIKSNEIPDVCVFVWTTENRLYNKEIRHINCYPRNYVYTLTTTDRQKKILDAAREYYEFLQDDELDYLNATSFFYYFDNIILKSFPDTIKIIHLWSFGDMKNGYLDYMYTWNHGVEIRPALVTLTSENGLLTNNFDPNHLKGDLKNEIVFTWIKNTIDNYGNINESRTIQFTD